MTKMSEDWDDVARDFKSKRYRSAGGWLQFIKSTEGFCERLFTEYLEQHGVVVADMNVKIAVTARTHPLTFRSAAGKIIIDDETVDAP